MKYTEYLVVFDDCSYKYCSTRKAAKSLLQEATGAKLYGAAFYPNGNGLLQRKWAEIAT